MLKLKIDSVDLFDEENEQFIKSPSATICLEHSLVSISKWEAIHKKSLINSEKTDDETIDYIRCMTITQNVPEEIYTMGLRQDHIDKITKYMADSMTATVLPDTDDEVAVREGRKTKTAQSITSEQIYGYMVQLRIPKEFEKWHINRLLTLIQVVGEMNKSPEKVDPKKQASRNATLNARRRAKYQSRG